MEFNVFEHFKGYQRSSPGPVTPEEQGSRFFLGGHMGDRIGERVDGYAARAGLSRRNFIGTASGFAAAMLAVNQITGMKFFEVSEAEAYDQAAAKEVKVARKAGPDFIVDAHTHICNRKDGYIPGVNTSEKGMWFVQLLDDLGKAMGLPNGTKDMTPENFGKLILEGSDTSVACLSEENATLPITATKVHQIRISRYDGRYESTVVLQLICTNEAYYFHIVFHGSLTKLLCNRLSVSCIVVKYVHAFYI